jgi:hypothetical protein
MYAEANMGHPSRTADLCGGVSSAVLPVWNNATPFRVLCARGGTPNFPDR